MKTAFKIFGAGVVAAIFVLAMQYIGSPENSINLTKDWGIAKDNPIKWK
jgi:hypothetical protein